MTTQNFWQKYQPHLDTLLVFALAAVTRLTALNVFRAVDEEDRWAWAVDFYRALLAGDLSATLVGDGYPGIFPVWLETLWLLAASAYRSLLQGQWFGDAGVYLLLHEWSRTEYLGMQRFPVALTNALLVVVIFLYTRKLFGRWPALLTAIFISLDPFYLSDSRVNRAEGLLTGLMTVSLLAFVAHHRWASKKHLAAAAIFAGLAMLTKSQALVLLPMFTVISLIWHVVARLKADDAAPLPAALTGWFGTMAGWGIGAALTFVALWPATWTVPGPTFSLMFNYATRKVGAEGVKIFFMGQTVLDEDPGLIFYPLIFILRTTPVMLLGLAVGARLLLQRARPQSRRVAESHEQPAIRHSQFVNSYIRKFANSLDDAGVWALLAYVLLYVGGMSLGSHKQDRFLMAVFPPLYILAALAFTHLAQRRHWSTAKMWLGAAALLAVQLVTALPHHPYYFSYFNPLVGGGRTAVQLTRVGWGEGMDQVADYLNTLDNPNDIVVATRFWRYLLDFSGPKLNLDADGEWARADKIIFYIQQSQRMLDPSPGVIRYFQQHVPPEKVITIAGIDYAQIFPNPIHYPANPQLDRIDGELSLFGYRWESEPGPTAAVRLIWENLSDSPNPAGVRLWANELTHTDWTACTTRPDFADAAHTPGEVVESDCLLAGGNLPPGLYDLQVGVQQPGGAWAALDFANGWSAVEVTPGGELARVAKEVAFAELAAAAIPASATPLEHLYYDRVRLLAYEVSPPPLYPGDNLTVTLYWQAQRVLDREGHISLQAFSGDNQQLAAVNGPPDPPTSAWRPGQVIQQEWTLALPPDTPAPAQVRLDVSLFLPETLTPLPVTNLAGEDIPAAIGFVRLEPPDGWPTYRGDSPLAVAFGDSIRLVGLETSPPAAGLPLDVTLYWEALAAPAADYTAFVHLLNAEGELIAQSDTPPGGGLFPTTAWLPGDVVLSRHSLTLPAGAHTLLAGLYRAADGARLPAVDANGNSLPNNAAPVSQLEMSNE